MIDTLRRDWKNILLQGVTGAIILIVLLVGLSGLTGQLNIQKRIEAETRTTRELICRISLHVHVGDQRIEEICSEFMERP